MSEFIGRIQVPQIVPSSTFPITPDFGSGMSQEPEISTFQFQSGDAKIEQRFVLGNGYRRFTVRRAVMNRTEINQLADFWELNKGAVGAFTYNAPDGVAYICRFADPKLTFDYLLDDIAAAGVVLQQIPATTPTLPLNSTVERFPTEALADALLSNVQTIIPLVRIRVRESAVDDILISDRRVQIGSNLYQARLTGWDGIQQSIDGAADQASFSFGNSDRVFSKLANDTSLFVARIEFSLYHVGTGTKIDLWAGNIQDWSFDSGPDFRVTAYDGIYELGLPYPARKISRTCWKMFNSKQCPYTAHGTPGQTSCDKSWSNCQTCGMQNWFGGIVSNPQTVVTKDNSTGVMGFGRNSMQSSSVVSDSIYSEVLPDIWYNDAGHPLKVNAKICAGRDEGDFYCALGIVGRGPLGAYTPYVYDDNSQVFRNTPVPTWHTLDGMPPHGPTYGVSHTMGLRQSLGHDPVQDNDPDGNSDKFSLGQGGDGIQTYGDPKAAGVAFVEIRRKDDKGLQLQPLSSHSMAAYVSQGLAGLVWTAPGACTLVQGVNNPIWVAVNIVLMAKGLWTEDPNDAVLLPLREQQFDVAEAVKAAAVCDIVVPPLVSRTNKVWVFDEGQDGEGNPITLQTGRWMEVAIEEEKQFTFNAAMVEQKPLRDWLTEIMLNCLGFYTFSFGKLRFGVRFHSGAETAFTTGNIVFNSLQVSALRPAFNRFTANFGDVDYDFAADSVSLYDADQAQFIGGAISPIFLDGNTNLSGTTTRSQAARYVTARLREEVGGLGLTEQKKARKLAFKTTILSLESYPGMVASLEHPDMPDGTRNGTPTSNYGEFRIIGWKLNKDYSIDIQGQTTTDSMYNMLVGPKPADVSADAIPTATVFPPADLNFSVTAGNGKITLADFVCATNGSTVHQGVFDLYYVPEDASSLSVVPGGCDDHTTTIPYQGDPPVPGEWILVGNEVMSVVSVTPGSDNTGTAKVVRGQCGTTAAAHARVSSSISGYQPDKATMSVSGAFLPGDLVATVPVGEWGIIASYAGGQLITTLPFNTLVGQSIFSDPRIYRVVKQPVVIPFAPRFFTSGARSGWGYDVDLPNAGLVAVSGYLENTRGERSEDLVITYGSSFPYRLRTGGNSAGLTFIHPVPPPGLTEDAFESIRVPSAQAFTEAHAEWRDDTFLDRPGTVPSVSRGNVQVGGTISLSSSATNPKGTVQVTIGEPGDPNYVALPALHFWGEYNIPFVAQNLAVWLDNNDEFKAFYTAYPVAGTGNITITDKNGSGGHLTVATTGEINATATGMADPLNIKTGRKYAVSFRAGSYESSVSPLSASSGPTGGANRIDLKGIPSSYRPDVDYVRVWATPDGKESPLYLVATVENGTDQAADTVPESSLASQTAYPGPSQPTQTGSCSITVKCNGNPWFQLRILNGSSNIVNGLALGALAEGMTLTADVDNSLAEGELRVFID